MDEHWWIVSHHRFNITPLIHHCDADKQAGQRFTRMFYSFSKVKKQTWLNKHVMFQRKYKPSGLNFLRRSLTNQSGSAEALPAFHASVNIAIDFLGDGGMFCIWYSLCSPATNIATLAWRHATTSHSVLFMTVWLDVTQLWRFKKKKKKWGGYNSLFWKWTSTGGAFMDMHGISHGGPAQSGPV